MKNHLTLIASLLLALVLTGCGSHKNDILGQWVATVQGERRDQVFNADGTATMTINGGSVNATWTLNGDTLSMNIDLGGNHMRADFQVVALSPASLTLVFKGDNETVVWRRP